MKLTKADVFDNCRYSFWGEGRSLELRRTKNAKWEYHISRLNDGYLGTSDHSSSKKKYGNNVGRYICPSA